MSLASETIEDSAMTKTWFGGISEENHGQEFWRLLP